MARQFASFNAKLDNPILEIRPVSFSQLLLQRSNLLIFRPGGGETAGFDITTFVQNYRLQTWGQSQQEVRLQGRTREHEDLPLRGRQPGEHEPMGECSDSGDAFAGSQPVSSTACIFKLLKKLAGKRMVIMWQRIENRGRARLAAELAYTLLINKKLNLIIQPHLGNANTSQQTRTLSAFNNYRSIERGTSASFIALAIMQLE